MNITLASYTSSQSTTTSSTHNKTMWHSKHNLHKFLQKQTSNTSDVMRSLCTNTCSVDDICDVCTANGIHLTFQTGQSLFTTALAAFNIQCNFQQANQSIQYTAVQKKTTIRMLQMLLSTSFKTQLHTQTVSHAQDWSTVDDFSDSRSCYEQIVDELLLINVYWSPYSWPVWLTFFWPSCSFKLVQFMSTAMHTAWI